MFDRGLTIFRVRGIPVKLHVTLLVFLPYVAFIASYQFRSIARAVGLPLDEVTLPPLVWGVILAIGLFVSILLHELAHCLVALRSGGGVRSITLMMLGGVSRMERDVRPDREAWMAFAGPLASFGVAVFAWLMQLLPFPPEVRVAFLALAFANLVLGAFNLLPAFPMDGGRVLRGLLVRRLGAMRATQVAATIGKVMAVLFALVGLLSFNVLLVLIAAFVYMGASGEQVRLELRHVLEGLPVSDVMTARLGEAHVDENAGEVARRLFQQNLAGALVKDTNGATSHDDGTTDHVLGIVTTNDLARPDASRGGPTATVGSTMRTDVPRVHARDDAATTLDALVNGDTDAVLVLDEGEHIVGLVTTADIQRAMALLNAFGGRWDSRR